MSTRTFERLIAALLVLAVMFLVIGIISIARSEAQVDPATNQVEYWCETGGVKYEPVDDPFIVPEPPEGKQWTMAVAKAGTTNEVFIPIVTGQAISHSLHENSHIILCWEDQQVTTSTTTTSVPTTTTTEDSTTTTTEPSTTTTDPTTTTSSSTSTTTTSLGTTTTSPTTTTTPTTSSTSTSTSTVPPTTSTTVTQQTLPVTGPPSGLSYGALVVTSLLLLALGTATIVGAARKGD